MTKNWEPDPSCYDVLKMTKINKKFAKQQLAEFRIFWIDSYEIMTSWNSKFIQHVKYKCRGIENSYCHWENHRQEFLWEDIIIVGYVFGHCTFLIPLCELWPTSEVGWEWDQPENLFVSFLRACAQPRSGCKVGMGLKCRAARFCFSIFPQQVSLFHWYSPQTSYSASASWYIAPGRETEIP